MIIIKKINCTVVSSIQECWHICWKLFLAADKGTFVAGGSGTERAGLMQNKLNVHVHHNK